MKRLAVAAALAALFGASRAEAFPGLYFASSNARVTNNATQIVVMREKTRTVMSIQPDYQGPVENFVLLLPVPASFTAKDVKTMSRTMFERIELYGAPRLVEYWEVDPCSSGIDNAPDAGSGVNVTRGFGGQQGAKVEARFAVAEYDVAVLGAKESSGIVDWLKANKYFVPPGADAYLKPLVESGSRFLAVKLDGKKLLFQNGIATYSPIRISYESDKFTIPLRYGLPDSPGVQEVVINVLARHQRYEAANYPNAFVPTNIDVVDGAKTQPATMYTAIFDATVAKTPRAFVTEFAWDATACDPCTTPPLMADELWTFGADQMGAAPSELANPATFGSGFVLSRLHARYKKDELTEDLVLRAADPVAGGREERNATGALDHGAAPASSNAFQARYAVRHAWSGKLSCAKPKRGVWGASASGMRAPTQGALRLPYAPRAALKLSTFLREDVPELDFTMPVPEAGVPEAGAAPAASATPQAPKRGCSGCTVGGATSAGWLTLVPIALWCVRRRRERR